MSISNSIPPKENKFALQTALFVMLVHIAFTVSIYLIGIRINAKEMQIASITTLIIALVCAISAFVIWRGRTSLGGWMMIASIAIIIPAISFIAANLGWTSLIAIPLLIVLIARQTLPNDRFTSAISIGLISGLLALLIDLFGPATRATIPMAGFIVPAVVLSLLSISVFFLIRQFQTFTLQTKLLILFLAVAIIPLTLLAFLDNRATRNTLTEAANQSLYSTGKQTANQIDSFFNNTVQSLQAEAQFTGFREFLTNVANGDFAFSTDAVVSMATLASKDSAHILSYDLIDRVGGVHVTFPVTQTPQNVNIIDVVPAFLGVNLAVETGMRTSMASGTPYISPVLFDENNQASILFVTPVFDILDLTNPVGLLVVEYDAGILQELMANQNELAGTDSFGVLFDENQLHIAHGTDPSTLYKTVAQLPLEEFERLVEEGRLPDGPYQEHSTDLPALSEKLSNTATEPFFTAIDVATGDRINQVAATQIDTKPWQVSFFQPQDVFLSIANQQTRDTILLVVVIAIIISLSSLGATRLLSSPITTLAELVESIAAGDLDLNVPVITQDEIGRLATAFNAMTAQIRGLLSGLEIQVAERTRALERQAVQLQTAAQVARDASNLQDLEDLLKRTVHLIHDRFGFYHAGIFLLDERGEFAVLRAANSEGGQEMLKRGHRLKVGQTGIVGFVTSQGEPRIALDVGTDITHFAHPLLPDTRSEIALPLMVGNRIIGALDVQSMEANAFDEGDITVLQVLADQLAIAIENSRLLAEGRQTVEELQTAYGEFTQESWLRWSRRTNQPTGYRYRGADIEPALQQSPETILALKQGQTITKVPDNPVDNESTLAIPIQLRNQTFGVINLHIEGNEIPADFINLVESISNRLAITLDSARLYEETQRRAAQEQITSEIASRFRESLDIDAVLKTAVQEIGQKLNLHDVSVQIELNGKSNQERVS